MIGSWQIQHLDAPSLCLELGLAHLDASINLCKDMKAGALPDTFHHAKVIMSLAYHGVELFLKFGIGRRNGGICPKGHSLRPLQTKYESLNPDPNLHFVIPFIPAYLGFSAADIEQKIQDEQPFDQHLRYHLNLKGQSWPDIHGFDVETYVSEVTSLCDTLRAISKKIEASEPVRRHPGV
ncbi:MAG: hypothetical protein AB1552_10980 [Nitrospirota bacterium]